MPETVLVLHGTQVILAPQGNVISFRWTVAAPSNSGVRLSISWTISYVSDWLCSRLLLRQTLCLSGARLFRILKPHLRDAFAEGGSGWPNTIINDTPWSRIDQIWISHHFAVRSGQVLRTEYSDHRMVVIDLVLRPSADSPHMKAAEYQ